MAKKYFVISIFSSICLVFTALASSVFAQSEGVLVNPEVGDEVIVEFEQRDTAGDPDRPVITSPVYNPDDPDTDQNNISGSQTAPSQTKVLILAPTADEQSTEQNNTDLFISNGQQYLRGGFLKLGDIKGESKDTSGKKGGNVEVAWKIEEGEKGSKPKEIVVVGSKVKDLNASLLTLTNCSGGRLVCNASQVRTQTDLEEYLTRSVNEGGGLNEIRLDDTRMELATNQPVRLFGFIPVNIKQRVEIATDAENLGRVKVKFPWWHVLSRKSIGPQELQNMIEDEISNAEISIWQTEQGDVPTENITLNFAEIKAVLHDTAMAVIRKIG